MILFHATADEEVLLNELLGHQTGALVETGSGWNIPYLWGINEDELVWFDWATDSIKRYSLMFNADVSIGVEKGILLENRRLDQILTILGHGICLTGEHPVGTEIHPGKFSAVRINILRLLVDRKLDADSILKGLKGLGIDLTGAGWKIQRNFISKGLQFQKLAEGSTAEEFVREILGEIDITNVKPKSF